MRVEKFKERIDIDKDVSKITLFVLKVLRKKDFEKYGNVRIKALKSKLKLRELADTRFFIFAMSTKFIKNKYISESQFKIDIGKKFNRDRATVTHGLQEVENVKELKIIFNEMCKKYKKTLTL